jgi:hypothetical protein
MYGTAGSEYASQHQENPRTYQTRSRLIITGLTGSTPWLRVDGDTDTDDMPGMIRIENLTFRIPAGSSGSVFEFGDPDHDFFDLGTGQGGRIRGLAIEGSYFTHIDLLSQTWLQFDATDGYTINPARNFAIKCTRAYDLSIRQCGFRGFAEQIVLRGPDRPLVENTHHFHCLRPIVCAPHVYANGASGVPGVFNNNYCETPLVSGFVIDSGQITNVRCEYGYDAVMEPNVGSYDLPTGMAWSIAAGGAVDAYGGGTINLTGIPAGKEATDYFMPHMMVKAIPSETYSPPRWYFIRSVQNTGVGTGTLTYENGATQSYTKAEITGDNTELKRVFGIGLIAAGARTSVNGYSLGTNTTSAVPYMAMCPVVSNMHVTVGSGTGVGVAPNDLDNLPVVAGHCCGTQNNVHTGVLWSGGERNPRNPLVEVVGVKYDANTRLAGHTRLIDRIGKFDIVCAPGMNITVANNVARDLQFHPLTEDSGEAVFAYKMTDAGAGWTIPGWETGRRYRYTARVYIDAAMDAAAGNKFTLYDGAAIDETLTGRGVGWHTLTGISGPSPGALSITHNRNYYLHWIGFEYIDGNETYTVTNVTTDRSFDADTAADAELADVLGTLIADLRAKGIVN